MDMILDTVAPVGITVHVHMSDGSCHEGYFNSHTFPFCSFKRAEDGDIIYIQREQITWVYVPAENYIVGH